MLPVLYTNPVFVLEDCFYPHSPVFHRDEGDENSNALSAELETANVVEEEEE